MALRYIPLHLKHPATPKITDFAILSGLEAAVRGTLISTVPIAVYDAFGSASNLSTVYLMAGVITLFWGLLVPRLTQLLPRRWVYSAGCGLYLVAMALFIAGPPLRPRSGLRHAHGHAPATHRRARNGAESQRSLVRSQSCPIHS